MALNFFRKVLSVAVVATLLAAPAHAQLKGDHLLGLSGIKSGTQAPAGLGVALIPCYLYTTDKLKNADGDVVAKDLGMSSYLTAPAFSWVLKTRILGANLGGTVLVPFVTNKISSAISDVHTSFNLSDLYVQPVQLGWHGRHADFVGGFALYIPTGEYKSGGDNNSGLGMWGYEFSAGSTVYFDKEKLWNFSSLFSYELCSKKKDSDMQVGNVLSIEGGAGRTWYHKAKGPIPVIFNAGLSYYMQFKTTDDKIPVGGYLLPTDKDHLYGLGVEGNVYLPSLRSQITLRWLGELGAVNRFQGNTLLVSWAYSLKSFR